MFPKCWLSKALFTHLKEQEPHICASMLCLASLHDLPSLFSASAAVQAASAVTMVLMVSRRHCATMRPSVCTGAAIQDGAGHHLRAAARSTLSIKHL